MKKARVIVWFVVIIFSLVSNIFATQKSKVPKEIKIGAILPLTGDGAKYGEEAKNGIELALEEIKDIKIKLIYEDDGGTSVGAINAFNKIVTINKVPVVVGPMYSSTALAVAPLGQKEKVIVFSPSASSPDLTNAGDYFFRNFPSDVYEGSEMAKYAYKVLNLKTVVILSLNLDYGTGLTKVFKKEFESLGGQILSVDFYNQGTTDFRTQLTKIKSLNPDALYLPGMYAEIGLVLKQAKEMGVKTQLLSCVGFNNPKVLTIAGNTADGVYFARPYYDTESQDMQLKTFVEHFKKKYGIEPGIYAAHAYDAMKIIALVIKNGSYTANNIKTALHLIKNYPGVTGNTSFDKNGDVIKPIMIMKVGKGEFVNVK
jgi:branched-chain amino acid transport system substrate-binding protein